MRTVLGVLVLLLLLSCAVPILAGWRNPSSRFLVGVVQTRDARSQDPQRTAAAVCWLILGFAAGVVGALGSWEADVLVGYAAGAVCVACLAVAAYVRFGDAPQWLRPAAMRDPV
ncbi:hypothetical protein [Nocardioides sp.]|uniref:hypothetical protein n=1 Tax=Nocardioides sp. TaxID=35761 RepID=UPI001A30C7BA|nr:hypothetical protein [Nocardioides sp.]MBJ7357869.1 hypothetical protein [Nocardioides sp.]